MQNAHARKSQVQKKLVAAVAMLLVSCVLVVNSTYAWFTLSTAPELTGISTSVGANGNLEMALLNDTSFADLTKITSGVGDSVADVKVSNVTWGNLVSMKDSTGADAYHLSAITLKPSRLNVSSTMSGTSYKLFSTKTPLQTPSYGADGRVASLLSNTVTGGWSGEGFKYNEANHGVIAIGTASSLTPGQQAIRNALTAMSNNMTGAIDTAQAAIKLHGGDLADIAIKHGLATDADGNGVTDETYDVNEVATVSAAVLKVVDAVNKIELALKNAIIVIINSQKDLQGASVTTDNIEFDYSGELTLVKVNNDGLNVSSDQTLTNALASLKALRAAADKAKTEADSLKASVTGDQTTTWNVISKPIDAIMSTSAMTINGYTVSGIKGNMQGFVNAVTAAGMKIDMKLKTGSGMFADIAEFCGDYSATVSIKEVTYNNLTVKDLPATMETIVHQDGSTATLDTIYGAIKALPAKDAEGGTKADAAITDYYGYMIDLAFRTNAASSNLLLQTTATQRIYSESTNEATQGSGSYMMFKASSGLTDQQMLGLMEAIRVVFINPDDGTIYGVATVDTSKVTTSAEGTKAYLYLRNFSFDARGAVQNTMGKLNITGRAMTRAEIEADTTIEAAIKNTITTNNWTDYAAWEAASKAEGASDEVKNFKWPTTTLASSNKLMELSQNVAKAMSALVYLDGDLVDNADVANGLTSMVGTLNLQFASDAKLTPMENTELMGDKASTAASSSSTG